MTTGAVTGAKCVLSRGNLDSATLAVRASRTMGSGASGLILYWGTPGTAGNSKTCSIVVAGVSTALSVVVTTSAVTINSATNGASAATSTVNQILAALYADATFLANWDARALTDGTGVIGAASSASLASGVAGETFSPIVEVKGVRGPSLSGGVVDVTSFDSAGVREFIATLRDGGTISFMANYIPNGAGTGHQLLLDDTKLGRAVNFVLTFPNLLTTEMSFSGIVTGAEISAELEQAVSVSVTIKVTGWPNWF
jgi:hypothetical protein